MTNIQTIFLIAVIFASLGLGWFAGSYNIKMMQHMTCEFDIKPLHESELK